MIAGIVCVGVFVLPSRSLGGAWSPWIGIAALIFAFAYTIASIRYRVGVALALQSPTVTIVAIAVLFATVIKTGGVRSPAAPAEALAILWFAHQYGLKRGALAGNLAILLTALADIRFARPSPISSSLGLAGVVLGGGLLPIWWGRRRAREFATERQQIARVEGYLAGRPVTPLGVPVLPSDLRETSESVRRLIDAQRDLWELDRFLVDVSDGMGAQETVFWRWNEAREAQRPAAWSTKGAVAPCHFDWNAHAPIVKWTAEGELMQCINRGGTVQFIAAPVRGGSGTMYGVLSIASPQGLILPVDEAKRWAARHAEQVALMVELLELRRHYKRHMRQSAALGNAARFLQETSKLEDLGRAICSTALEVTSAERSTLIQWRADERRGAVQAVSHGHVLRADLAVTEDSYVGRQCTAGEPLYKHDARLWSRNGVVYGYGEGRREIASLAIVPLHQQGVVVGALVVEGDEVERMGIGEVRNLKVLAGFASTALGVAWEIAEAGRRARTDILTGLANRAYFDERLEDLLNQADRFGTPTALVVADIDFFKSVNDSYGHDAGDNVLRHVAQVFTEHRRSVDLCARYGGEEIAILMPQTTLSGALDGAERFRAALALRPAKFSGREIRVTASFGVAAYPETVQTRSDLFAAADRALYQAKAEGRNCVRRAAVSTFATES